MIARSNHPLEIFYSYSHRDEELRDRLAVHLKALKREGLISEWHDRQIEASTDWKHEIDEQMDTADLILLLVSPDFIASDYCYEVEMNRALKRHQRKDARIIPIILRPCIWRKPPLDSIQALPKDGKPVTDWSSFDAAFLNVVEGIEQVIKSIVKERGGLTYDWINSILLRRKVVRHVQTFLNQNGYLQGGIDGIPGEETKKAVLRFQKDYGLKADGLIGPATLDKLASLE